MEDHPSIVSHANEQEMSRELKSEEARRSELTEWMKPNAEGDAFIPTHFNDKFKLKALDKVAKRLIKSKDKLTREVEQDGCKVLQLTPFGRRLATNCNLYSPELFERYSRYTFNPWIELMGRALYRWHGGRRFATPLGSVPPEDHKRLGLVARYVRLASRSRWFNRRLGRDRQRALQDYWSGVTFLMSLFARHSRLLILRIDLYYRDEGWETALSEEARATFERFLRALRRGRIVPEVLGRLVSREVGVERGVHFHLMVVMDGHRFRDADGYTRMIGERWVEDYARDGRGSYYNCYTRRDEYKHNGLGLVHIADAHKLIGVRLALKYVTKAEYLIRPKGKHQRNFRRSLVKEAGVKRGAPRQTEDDLSTAWRILGGAEDDGRST